MTPSRRWAGVDARDELDEVLPAVPGSCSPGRAEVLAVCAALVAVAEAIRAILG